MSRPVWLLDVDGVVNVARPGWGAATRSGSAYSGATAYRMRWAPALIERIRLLHRIGHADIRWCSTWCAEAEQIERLFGLPRLDRSWYHEVSAATAPAAKLDAARAVLNQGRHLVWTDDTEVPTSGPIYEELTRTGRALLIAPSPRLGLQPEHLGAIEAFTANAVAASTAVQDEALLRARPLLGDDSDS
ncbi:hypothetical protein [Micromonospora sp. CB01531]|uniref:hypothetical protein n=1 Tax=Micromonospora sp. CB01531 TaxID=1718947 RepID=UPI00093D8B51|nr:hypothetical protein [Micromonospora sp. CB01531]OKI63421.1 hypothetical protein A6A27_26770 [Micromonospora sp. CB01531]